MTIMAVFLEIGPYQIIRAPVGEIVVVYTVPSEKGAP